MKRIWSVTAQRAPRSRTSVAQVRRKLVYIYGTQSTGGRKKSEWWSVGKRDRVGTERRTVRGTPGVTTACTYGS
jgi:hypothetical protein